MFRGESNCLDKSINPVCSSYQACKSSSVKLKLLQVFISFHDYALLLKIFFYNITNSICCLLYTILLGNWKLRSPVADAILLTWVLCLFLAFAVCMHLASCVNTYENYLFSYSTCISSLLSNLLQNLLEPSNKDIEKGTYQLVKTTEIFIYL